MPSNIAPSTTTNTPSAKEIHINLEIENMDIQEVNDQNEQASW